MQETPYTKPLTELFQFIGQSWALTQNAWGMWNVYLYYKARWLPLGTADVIVSLSPSELMEKVDTVRRASDSGAYPWCGNLLPTETLPNPYAAPEIAPRNPWEGLDTLIGDMQSLSQQQHLLAQLSIPQSVLQQILQLPDGYDIKHIAIEDGTLCVYCLTPETAELSPKDVIGTPIMTADYQLETSYGTQWRSLKSVRVDIARMEDK